MPKVVYVATNGGQGEKLVQPPAIFSDTAPTGTFEAGQRWIDTIGGREFVWYVDANSSQWVEWGESTQGAGGIDGGNILDTYLGVGHRAFDGGTIV